MLTALVVMLAVQVAGAQPDPSADPLRLVAQGRRAVQQGNHAEALRLYEQALEAQPDLVEGHIAAGIVLDLMGEYERAREHLTKAIELAPPELTPTALQAMAVSYVFGNETADAARFFQQLFDHHNANGNPAGAAAAANALGRVYLEAGKTEEARRWYETGYEVASRQPDEPASQLPLWQFRWLHAQGRIAAREKKAGEARRHVAAARKLVESTPSLSDEGPTLAYLAGYVAFHLGDYRQAREELAKADQNDPFILMLEAQTAERLRDRAAAQEFWKKVLQSNAHN
ncbi:MAG TPA: tetratricopeptide repeat protein, partial [Vicinamibacterales bacterium]